MKRSLKKIAGIGEGYVRISRRQNQVAGDIERTWYVVVYLALMSFRVIRKKTRPLGTRATVEIHHLFSETPRLRRFIPRLGLWTVQKILEIF